MESTIPARFFETSHEINISIATSTADFVSISYHEGYHPIGACIIPSRHSTSSYIVSAPMKWPPAAASAPNWAVRIYNYHTSAALTIEGMLRVMWAKD